MQTEIEQLANDYPHLAAAFARIPQGEVHLQRLEDLNSTWQRLLQAGATRQYAEVVVSAERTALPVCDNFDVIYAGGGLNFYYAEAGDHVDLLQLFEDFFMLLPSYKDSSQVEIIKPVYGFIPAGYNITLPWQKEQKILAYDHVLSLGDAAAFQSPLTFCGFGSYVRNLRRITTLLNQALKSNCLQAADLNQIRAAESVPALARAFSKFMVAKTGQKEEPWQVNETLNVFCHVLNDLGAPVTNAFFKDRVGWFDYTRIVLSTPRYYAKIYSLALKTLTMPEILGWISAWFKLGRQSVLYTVYRLVRPLFVTLPGSMIMLSIQSINPRLGLRMAIWRATMQQIGRGKGIHERAARLQSGRLGDWLGARWP